MSNKERSVFALKPKGNDAYAKAARAAMLTYSYHINSTDPNLSTDLRRWVVEEISEIGKINSEHHKPKK